MRQKNEKKERSVKEKGEEIIKIKKRTQERREERRLEK